jgi:hypothetical protein
MTVISIQPQRKDAKYAKVAKESEGIEKPKVNSGTGRFAIVAADIAGADCD